MNVSINVSMPERLRSFIDFKVRAGGYSSASEYLRELVRVEERLEIARSEAERERESERGNFRREQRPLAMRR